VLVAVGGELHHSKLNTPGVGSQQRQEPQHTGAQQGDVGAKEDQLLLQQGSTE